MVSCSILFWLDHWLVTRLISPVVRQSKNPCLVGLSGIVVHETENAFKMITQKDQLKRP